MQPIIWGTGGHIDHGKTALIKALTGTDTDRLDEEKARGLTIDIGFAFLTDEISFIDVPGHEKFVKNMVTGVSTIDAGLLVIAADDGVMPQTKEHLAIMSLLGIPAGCIVISKIDLMDDEWIDLVEETVREQTAETFLETAPVVRTSTETGEGIDKLRSTLLELSAKLPRRLDRGIPRLPVDRDFSVKGFGTVVTGSVVSGSFHTGDSVEILPEKKLAKIRGIQTHGHDVQSIGMSERAALNLSNIDKKDIDRGMEITREGWLNVSRLLYASVRLLKSVERPLKPDQRVRLHLGTTEILARTTVLSGQNISPGEQGFVKLRLEEPATVAFHDRFIIRFYSPMFTIGGGQILSAKNMDMFSKNQLLEFLDDLHSPELDTAIKTIIRINGPGFLSKDELSKELFFSDEQLTGPLEKLISDGELEQWHLDDFKKFANPAAVETLKEKLLHLVSEYHEDHPKEPGYARSQLLQEISMPADTVGVVLDALIKEGVLKEEGPFIKKPNYQIRLTETEEATKEKIFALIEEAGLQPPSFKDLIDELDLPEPELRQYLKLLSYENRIERISGELYLATDLKTVLKEKLSDYFTKQDTLSVGDFKTLIGGSRKYAIPLLEYADAMGWTVREGEGRKQGYL